MRNGELVGDVSVRHAPLEGGEISGAQVAEMIDELPMLAALGRKPRRELRFTTRRNCA